MVFAGEVVIAEKKVEYDFKRKYTTAWRGGHISTKLRYHICAVVFQGQDILIILIAFSVKEIPYKLKILTRLGPDENDCIWRNTTLPELRLETTNVE
jgi:hypothetical protein